MTLEGLKCYLKNPLKLYAYFGSHRLLNWMPDEMYLKIGYRINLGKRLNLKAPQTFNEKIQWLKINNRNDIYSLMVDKYEVKQYVASIIGDQYIIPTIGIWDNFDEIDFELLPEQFVLKCTHDSGGVVICRDKKTFNYQSARKLISKCMKRNYYWSSREWPYKNVKPRIIAEPYLEDRETETLNDYKFFCFNGTVKCYKIDFNRFTNHQANYYDRNNNLLPFGEVDFPPAPSASISIPNSISEMIELSEKLAEGQPFIRIDFYYVNGRTLFGEITFYPATGFGRIEPEEWDSILGDWIDLSLIREK